MIRLLIIALLASVPLIGVAAPLEARDIRDSRGNLVGRVKQEGSTTVLRDARGNPLGRVSNGVAYDQHGRRLGSPDMLMLQLNNVKR